MTPVERVTGRAYPLGRANVDTDVIIPARWMKRMSRTGFGAGAFELLRADADNVFDDPRFSGAHILIAGANFGCGSSREHAVWALRDLGVQALVAPSFSDIFARNAAKNGLIPAVVPPGVLDRLLAAATLGELTVDLVACNVRLPDQQILEFSIDAYQRQCLLDGTDDIDRTLAETGQLSNHEARLEVEQPWV